MELSVICTVVLPNAVGVSVQVSVCFCVFFPWLSVIMLMSSRHKISSPLGKVAIVGSKWRPVEKSSVCAPVLVYNRTEYYIMLTCCQYFKRWYRQKSWAQATRSPEEWIKFNIKGLSSTNFSCQTVKISE